MEKDPKTAPPKLPDLNDLTPKERRELLYVKELVNRLGWEGADLSLGSDPPDVLISVNSETISAEVRTVYHQEGSDGSLAREREGIFQSFLSDLVSEYYQENEIKITVDLLFFKPPESPRALREWLNAARPHLVRAAAQSARHRCIKKRRLHLKGGQIVVLDVKNLPDTGFDGPSRRWRIRNNHTGFLGSLTAEQIQKAIDTKATRLPHYRNAFSRNLLLLVADANLASGFVEVCTNKEIECAGFDEVYFLATGVSLERLCRSSQTQEE